MAREPRGQQDIYKSIRSRISGEIPELTNFTTSSFNWVWTQAYSAEIREVELDTVAAYLEGFIDYAGGPIDESDLDQLGLSDTVDVEEINDRLEESNLDELVKVVSVTRDPGTESSGTVTFTVDSDSIIVPSGTVVSTEPDYSGDVLKYETTEQVSPSTGNTTVDAAIEAQEVGQQYNVGANTITNLVDEPNGVQSVTNDDSVTGGDDRETNDELRERAKEALLQRTEGGTVDGVETYVSNNVDNIDDIRIEEVFNGDNWHGDYPHGHLVVEGGDDDEIRGAVEDSRPVAIRQFLVRPTVTNIDADISISSGRGAVSTSETEGAVERYLDSLGFGDELIYNKIVQRVLNSDEDIEEINSIDLLVGAEPHYFNEEMVDNFEDNDILVNNRHWGDWEATEGDNDLANFEAQDSTVLDGNYSGRLESSNEDVRVRTQRTSSTSRFSVELTVQIDNQTGNDTDWFILWLKNNSDIFVDLRFQGDGLVQFGNSNDFGNWSSGVQETVRIDLDFDSETVTVALDEDDSSSSTNFLTSVSGLDEIELVNYTLNSGASQTAYVDNINLLEPIQELNLGHRMPNDGINSVTTDEGGGKSYIEPDNWDEYDLSGNGHDSIRWNISQEDWPGTVQKTETLTFRGDIDTYTVDPAMYNEGIIQVQDDGGKIYDEGISYEEYDTSNNGMDDGIEWFENVPRPDDGQNFTVTYNAAVKADIEYDITDDDIEVSQNEKVNSGTIEVTEQ